MKGTKTIGQIRPDKTHERSHPLWDGNHNGGLDLKATRADESHDPNDRDRGPQLLSDDPVINNLKAATNSCTML